MRSYRETHVGLGAGEKYDSMHIVRVDSMVWQNFVKPMVRNLMQYESDNGATRYLDFACGTGRLLKVGAPIFKDSTGIDVSPDMLEVARRRVPNAKLYCIDVTRVPSLNYGLYDCCTLFRFLLNAEADLRVNVLNWLASRMKPGALLIVNNHRNSRSLGGQLARVARPDGRRELNTLSRSATESMLREAGFEIESCHGYRMLPSIHGRPMFGKWLQQKGERALLAAGLGRFGSELVFTARRQ